MGKISDALTSGPPDWIMIGVPIQDGTFAIIASSHLDAAEIDFRARSYQFRDWADFQAHFTPQIDLVAHGRDYVIAQGTSYLDALHHLVEHWDPDHRDTHQPTPIEQTRAGTGYILDRYASQDQPRGVDRAEVVDGDLVDDQPHQAGASATWGDPPYTDQHDQPITEP